MRGKGMRTEIPAALAQRRLRSLSIRPAFDASEMKMLQRCKIQELRTALTASGIVKVDEQAKVLGLSRSTAWTVLSGNYKNSGLSAAIINRMLASPRLPVLARQKIFEYVQEKIIGLYGHSKRRRRVFATSLPIARLNSFAVEESQQRDSRQRRRRRQLQDPSELGIQYQPRKIARSRRKPPAP